LYFVEALLVHENVEFFKKKKTPLHEENLKILSLSPAWGKRIRSALALHEKPNADK